VASDLSLGFELSLLGDDIAGTGLLLHQLGSVKARLGGDDHLYIFVAHTFDGCFLIHVVGSPGHASQDQGQNRQCRQFVSQPFPS